MALSYTFDSGKMLPGEQWKREGKPEWATYLHIRLREFDAWEILEHLPRQLRELKRDPQTPITIMLSGELMLEPCEEEDLDANLRIHRRWDREWLDRNPSKEEILHGFANHREFYAAEIENMKATHLAYEEDLKAEIKKLQQEVERLNESRLQQEIERRNGSRAGV